MSRRKKAEKREILPDVKYNSILVAKFINNLMKKGKKSVAEKIFYSALEIMEKKTGEDGLLMFERAISNVKPALEVRPKRIGGATYQVPMEVRPARKQALAIRWILESAKKRSERTMPERLAAELIAATKKEGAAIKKREDTHRMAEANKAFAHFRW